MFEIVGLSGFHAFLEAFPLSSSWHIQYFFQTNSNVTHNFHLSMIPIIYGIVTLEALYQPRILKHKFFIFFSVLPAMIVYLLIKMHIFSKISLNMGILNTLSGFLVLMCCVQQKYRSLSLPELPPHFLWFLMGCTQIFGIAISGFSRLGASLLPALFFKMPFHESLIVSFLFEICILSASLIFDILNHKISFYLAQTHLLGSLCANLIGFGTGWMIIKRWKWDILMIISIYRILLGLFLYFGS